MRNQISSNFLFSLVENLSDIVFVVDRNSLINFVSPSVTKILGYTAEDLIGKTFFEFIRTSDHTGIRAKYLELLSHNEPFKVNELRVIHKNGSVRIIGGTAKNLLNDPEIEGVILTGQDITDKYYADKELLHAKKLLENIEKIAGFGGWEMNILTEEIFLTDEAARLHGISFGKSISKNDLFFMIKDLYSIEDIREFDEQINNCIKTALPFECEISLNSAEGRKWVRINGEPVIDNNAFTRIIGTFIDSTERKKRQMLYEGRLRLIELSNNSTLDQFVSSFLDEAEKLSGSNIGFYHFISSDQDSIQLQCWSTNTLNNMCSAEGKGFHYEISKAGIWAECFHARTPVIHNDYNSAPNKKGMPEGHAPVTRELVVPVIRADKVVSILGVGNKRIKYDQDDVDLLSELSDMAWDIIERKRSTELLRKQEEHLAILFYNSPSAIWEEDFSGVKKKFDEFRENNITDLNQFLTEHPSELVNLASLIKIVDVNKVSLDILGINSKKELVVNLQQYFREDSFPAFKDEMVALWEGKRLFECEIPVYNISGERLILAIKLTVLPRHYHDLRRVVVSFIDVTSQKRAEQVLIKNEELQRVKNKELEIKNSELRRARIATLNIIEDLSKEINDRKSAQMRLAESENKMRLLVEGTSYFFFFNRIKELKISYISPSVLPITGYTAREMMCRTDFYATDSAINQSAAERVSKLLEGEEFHEPYNLEIMSKQGEKILLEIYEIPLFKKGEIVGLQGIAHDVTQKDRLLQRVKKLSSAVEQSPVSIVITNINGEIEYVSPKFTHLTGYTMDEVVGKNPKFLNSGYHPREFYADLWDTILAGRNWAGIMRNKKKNGELVWESTSISPIINEEGKIINFVAVKEDITEKVSKDNELMLHREHLEELVGLRTTELNKLNKKLITQLKKEKQLEERLKEALSKEREINELKTKFIATVSHEFRTPLSALLTSAQMIKRYSHKWTEEKLNLHYERINSTLNYLTQLLDDVLTISWADREILKNNPEQIDIVETVNFYIDELKSEFKPNHSVEVIDKLPVKTLFLDKKLFRHIVVNLITNATKYSPGGGRIILKLELVKGNFVVSVSDEGIGIAEEELKYIFDAFYRTSESVGIPGSGLGLNIVKRSVDIMGGQVSVKSVRDSGTTFIIRIPVNAS